MSWGLLKPPAIFSKTISGEAESVATPCKPMPRIAVKPTLQKWNEATQHFDLNTFSAGAWSIPSMTLNPGEGVFVQPTTATYFTFIGDVPQGTLANPFPSGDSIRSSMVPQTGPIDTDLGLPLINNDVIYRYDNAAGNLVGYVYYSDGQSYAWVPEVPVPRVGESFWIRTTTSRTWSRKFAIW